MVTDGKIKVSIVRHPCLRRAHHNSFSGLQRANLAMIEFRDGGRRPSSDVQGYCLKTRPIPVSVRLSWTRKTFLVSGRALTPSFTDHPGYISPPSNSRDCLYYCPTQLHLSLVLSRILGLRTVVVSLVGPRFMSHEKGILHPPSLQCCPSCACPSLSCSSYIG